MNIPRLRITLAMLFHDRATIEGKARITRDGYFVADALVAQADNIQDYRPDEIGQQPKADGSLYRIGRPGSEVFADAALASAAHRPITIGHPGEDVTSENWKRLAVGDIGDEISQQGKFVRVPVKLMDAGGIRAVRSTHQEFSLGYTADVDMTTKTMGDQAVDGVVRNIRYNHLALVPRARGGSELRIIDERPDHLRDHQEQRTMKIKIGDAEVDATNGEAVKIAVDVLNGKLSDAQTGLATATTSLADAAAKVATLETEKATLTQQLADAKVTPEKLRDAAKGYALAIGKATALGVKVEDSMDEPAIMKAVVSAKMGDTAKDWNGDQIAASFAVLTKDTKVADAAPVPNGTPVALGDAATAANDARTAMIADMLKPAVAA